MARPIGSDVPMPPGERRREWGRSRPQGRRAETGPLHARGLAVLCDAQGRADLRNLRDLHLLSPPPCRPVRQLAGTDPHAKDFFGTREKSGARWNFVAPSLMLCPA